MLEKLKESLDAINKSKEFIAYKKKHKDSYLASCFLMADYKAPDTGSWQFDFYSPEKHELDTFKLVEGKLQVEPHQQVFQEKKARLERLDLEKVKVGFVEAIESVTGLLEKEYNSETPVKVIMVLQEIDEGAVWNITTLTASFKVLNAKLDAVSGKITHHAIESIFSFKKPLPPKSS